jgi:universal stress protein A
MLKPTKILVPTDFSEHSDKALRQALDIASEYKAKVYALHVVDEKLETTTSYDHSGLIINLEEIQRLEKDLLQGAREKLHKQAEKFTGYKHVPLVQKVIHGVPSEEILREQEKLGADLIVIASLGKSGIAKFLIGSVANNVLRGAKCPVLLTK